MHRWWKALVLAAVIVVTVSGCMDYEEEITLARDGSGTVRIHYYMDESMAQMMAGETTPFPFDEASIEAIFKDAPVKLVKSEVYTENEQKHVVLVIEFPDLEKLQECQFFADRTISMVRRDDGAIEFRMVITKGEAEVAAAGAEESVSEESVDGEFGLDDTDWVEEGGEEEYSLPEDAEFDAEMEKMAEEMTQALLAGHSFKYSLNVPGEIIEANGGGVVKGRQVTWEFPLTELEGTSEIVLTVTFRA